jgi:hypothetical protein
MVRKSDLDLAFLVVITHQLHVKAISLFSISHQQSSTSMVESVIGREDYRWVMSLLW